MRTAPLAVALLLALAAPARADVIVLNLGEQNGPDPFGGFPVQTDLHTFNFAIPAGHEVVAAEIESAWGNSMVNSSGTGELFIGEFSDPNGSVVVADCQVSQPCADLTPNPVPLDHTFLSSELAQFADGSVDYFFIQQTFGILRLGPTTLTITTAPAVPSLNGIGLVVAAALLLGALVTAAPRADSPAPSGRSGC